MQRCQCLVFDVSAFFSSEVTRGSELHYKVDIVNIKAIIYFCIMRLTKCWSEIFRSLVFAPQDFFVWFQKLKKMVTQHWESIRGPFSLCVEQSAKRPHIPLRKRYWWVLTWGLCDITFRSSHIIICFMQDYFPFLHISKHAFEFSHF